MPASACCGTTCFFSAGVHDGVTLRGMEAWQQDAASAARLPYRVRDLDGSVGVRVVAEAACAAWIAAGLPRTGTNLGD